MCPGPKEGNLDLCEERYSRSKKGRIFTPHFP